MTSTIQSVVPLKSNGVVLAYDIFGDDTEEAVVLISGLGAQRVRWTVPFCEALAACGYRVIRFDNRDSGHSTHLADFAPPVFSTLAAVLNSGERPDVPYTLDDMAADALGLLDALSIERAHFVGRSMGGMIAQIVASERPERTLSLTSIMSSTGNPALPQAAPDVFAMMMRPAPDPSTDLVAYLSHHVAFARRIAGSGHPFDEDAHRALLMHEVRRAYDPAGTARQFAAIAATGDLRPRLSAIDAPALVIHGADDPLILPACGMDTAASIAGSDLMIIEGMGHDLPPTFYGAVIEAIDQMASVRCERR